MVVEKDNFLQFGYGLIVVEFLHIGGVPASGVPAIEAVIEEIWGLGRHPHHCLGPCHPVPGVIEFDLARTYHFVFSPAAEKSGLRPLITPTTFPWTSSSLNGYRITGKESFSGRSSI